MGDAGREGPDAFHLLRPYQLSLQRLLFGDVAVRSKKSHHFLARVDDGGDDQLRMEVAAIFSSVLHLSHPHLAGENLVPHGVPEAQDVRVFSDELFLRITAGSLKGRVDINHTSLGIGDLNGIHRMMNDVRKAEKIELLFLLNGDVPDDQNLVVAARRTQDLDVHGSVEHTASGCYQLRLHPALGRVRPEKPGERVPLILGKQVVHGHRIKPSLVKSRLVGRRLVVIQDFPVPIKNENHLRQEIEYPAVSGSWRRHVTLHVQSMCHILQI